MGWLIPSMGARAKAVVEAASRNGSTPEKAIIIKKFGSPTQYKCVSCGLWYVESDLELMLRERDWGAYDCEKCHRKDINERYEKLRSGYEKEWEQYDRQTEEPL